MGSPYWYCHSYSRFQKLARRQAPIWADQNGRNSCGGRPKKSRAQEVNDRNSAKWPHDKHEKTRTKGTDIKKKEKTQRDKVRNEKLEGQKSCCTDDETPAEDAEKLHASKIEYQKRDQKQEETRQRRWKRWRKVERKTTSIGTRWRNWRVREKAEEQGDQTNKINKLTV